MDIDEYNNKMTVNQRVAGSSPAEGAFEKGIDIQCLFLLPFLTYRTSSYSVLANFVLIFSILTQILFYNL
jgi:hypothetical protein